MPTFADEHAFCRAHLREVRAGLTKQQRAAIRKAWTFSVLGQHEFHAPDGFYWHGRACCKWEARAKGIEAWREVQQ